MLAQVYNLCLWKHKLLSLLTNTKNYSPQKLLHFISVVYICSRYKILCWHTIYVTLDTIELKTIIFICGVYNILFALFHLGFWKMFQWDKDLKKLSFANKGIMQILNIQICYYFIFTATICFVFPTELLTTSLGNWFLVGNSLFWLIRMIQQFIFLRANHYKIHIEQIETCWYIKTWPNWD